MSTRLEKREKFKQYHADNPHVLRFMLRTIRQLKAAGMPRVTIAMIFEYTRIRQTLRTKSNSGFKISNDLKPYYARKINRIKGFEGTFKLHALKKDAE